MFPYLFLSPGDGSTELMSATFASFNMLRQAALYSIARICSFIFIPDLQAAMVATKGLPHAVIVVCVSEVLGTIAHFSLVK